LKVKLVRNRKIEDYSSIIGEEEIEKIKNVAEKIRRLKVVHVNSTSFGGGVAEILHSLIPLFNSVGVKAVWEVMEAPEEFFHVTKKLHNGIQGMKVDLSEEEKKLYLEVNRENAEKLDLEGDAIIIHDPQPAAIISFANKESPWAWRCHIDASTPYKPIWDFVSEFITRYDAYIFHMENYVKPELSRKRVWIIKPSIDPLSDKNRELSDTEVLRILERYDIDPEKPILVQVARFDPWKDPLGAIDVYRIVKKKLGEAQLLLVASMAHDDPEGWIYYEKALRHAGEDYDIHFLTNLVGVGDIEVNVFQRAADVALQMSTREGFGLAVTEALWKKTPVVARGVGGIVSQVIDGWNGYLINTVEEAAERAIRLIKDKKLREKMGENGREFVKRNFLITRHLRDYLSLVSSLIQD